MKCRLYTYVHESNGIAIELMPETDVELHLLAGFWKFGRLEKAHGGDDVPHSEGFVVRAFKDAVTEPAASKKMKTTEAHI